MPLDRTIQELEARLPDLRHLIADGELVIATSESAALLADELESLLSRADTVARRLRQLLLGGDVSALLRPEPAPVTEPAPAEKAPMEAPAAPAVEPAAWSEMDDDLARILAIATETDPPEADEDNEINQGKQKLEALRRQYNLSATAGEPDGESDAERQLRELEEKLGIGATGQEDRAYIEQLQLMAQQFVEDKERLKDLWREMGIDPNPPDDLPGGAAVGAHIDPSPPLRGPGAERTFAESDEAPRNP